MTDPMMASAEIPTLVRKIIREQRVVYGHDLNENLLFEIAKACVYAGIKLGSGDRTKLIAEFTGWVERYADRECPPGCLPTPGQIAAITLLARVTLALEGKI